MNLSGARKPTRWALAVGAAVVIMAALVAVPAYPLQFGISVLKDCQSPIHVGDPYSCEFEISNTVQTSHNTVTVTSLSDTVNASGGAVTATFPINSSSFGGGLILAGGATCDVAKCTIPFGGSVTTPFI